MFGDEFYKGIKYIFWNVVDVVMGGIKIWVGILGGRSNEFRVG